MHSLVDFLYVPCPGIRWQAEHMGTMLYTIEQPIRAALTMFFRLRWVWVALSFSVMNFSSIGLTKPCWPACYSLNISMSLICFLENF